MEFEEEGQLLSFRILEVASGKKKKTLFSSHILEVHQVVTFAKALRTLNAINADRTVALSDYSTPTHPLSALSARAWRDDAGTRQKVSLQIRTVRCRLPLFWKLITFEVVSPQETTSKLDVFFSVMMNTRARQKKNN